MLVCLRILIIILETKLNEIVGILANDLLAQDIKLLLVEIGCTLRHDHVLALWPRSGVLNLYHVWVSTHVHHLNGLLPRLGELLLFRAL